MAPSLRHDNAWRTVTTGAFGGRVLLFAFAAIWLDRVRLAERD